MKGKIYLRLMLLIVAVLMTGLFGCDEEKEDNSLLTALAASGALCGDWTIISPEDGATDVSTDNGLEMEHNGDLYSDWEGGAFDDIEITLKYDGGQLTLNYENSKIGITGNIAYVYHGGGYLPNTKYSSITIEGFKDAEGKPLPECLMMGYDFTTGAAPE